MHIGLINAYDILLFIQLDYREMRSSVEKLLMETCKAPHVQRLFDHGFTIDPNANQDLVHSVGL
jgi:hypothetical protein